MTERKSLESERAELMAAIEAPTSWRAANVLRFERIKEIDTELRSLAAQDQKPVALAHVRLEDDGLFADLEVLDGTNLQPSMSPVALYLSPPPAAGWDEAIEACKKVAEKWLESFMGREAYVARSIVNAIEALRTPAATKSERTFGGTALCGHGVMAAICEKCNRPVMPDHGGADAGVGDILAAVLFAKWSGEANGWPDGEWSEPDWGAWRNRTKLNPVGLSRTAFEEEADFLLKEVRPALSKPAPVAANASAEARDFCTYGPPAERKRQWIIVFEDADRGMMIFSDEKEAHTAWDKAKDNWTCTLFETSERKYHWAAGELRPLNASAETRLREALIDARQFIRNGIDFGFIRMPDDKGDPAHGTLPKIEAALSAHPHASDCDKQGEAKCPECGGSGSIEIDDGHFIKCKCAAAIRSARDGGAES